MKKEIKGFILGCVTTAIIGGGIAIASNATNIEVYPNNVSIYANGEYVDTPNFTYNDTTYVPLRAVLEKMDCNIEYDDNAKTVKASNNYLDITSIMPFFLNGEYTPYKTIMNVDTAECFVISDILKDDGFDMSSTEHLGFNGVMCMDSDKYVAIDPTLPSSKPAPSVSTPKPQKPTPSQNYFDIPDDDDDTEEKNRISYEAELQAINDKYDAMIEIIRSSYAGSPSSMAASAMGQQIQQYETQRKNEINQLKSKYGY